MPLRSPGARARWMLLAAAAVGVAVDVLFWRAAPGLSIPVFTVVLCTTLLAGLAAAGARPRRRALVLLVPAIVLSTGPALREEPMTAALTTVLSLGLVALFAHTALDGLWLRYGVRDHARAAGQVIGAGVAGGAGVVVLASHDVREQLGPAGRRAVPALRGVAMAVPVLAFFAVLLGSADPVFAARIEDALRWLNPFRVDELAARAVIVLLVTYGVAGVFAHAARLRPDRPGVARPLGPLIGHTEAAIVLGSVNLLFAAFVAVQVRYLFGGAGHLSTTGLTFAEYARRGFGELVIVAIASLVLLLALAATTRREQTTHRRLFSVLAAVLALLVVVILASSYLRLHLYEEAFGFTRARTYAHVFMVWLGLLLAALLVLILRERLRQFTTACLIAAVGFTLTLQLLNVDGFIASRNVARVATGAALDGEYLANVSLDAVPALVTAAEHASPALRSRIDEQLACHADVLAQPRRWQSQTLAVWRARRALASYRVSDVECPPAYRSSY